eukprot:SAG22_NODE_2707_length_2294_cov_54.614123_1_plen_143_part_10
MAMPTGQIGPDDDHMMHGLAATRRLSDGTHTIGAPHKRRRRRRRRQQPTTGRAWGSKKQKMMPRPAQQLWEQAELGAHFCWPAAGLAAAVAPAILGTANGPAGSRGVVARPHLVLAHPAGWALALWEGSGGQLKLRVAGGKGL